MFHASDLIYHPSSGCSLFDPLAPAELARVVAQYQIIKRVLQEPLPELETGDIWPSSSHMLLDLGCGPDGEWTCDVAFEYPHCHVFGISSLTRYVQQAEMFRHLQDLPRARFLQMGFTRELCFPDAFFDLVHARFLCSFLPSPSWPHLLRECLRVLRPGGILRLTECSDAHCNSPACETLSTSYKKAVYGDSLHEHLRADFPVPATLSITTGHTSPEILLELAQRIGYQIFRNTTHILDFSSGILYQQSMRCNAQAFFHQLAPLLCQRTELTRSSFEHLFEQMNAEMLDPAFRGHWTLQLLYMQKPGGQAW